MEKIYDLNESPDIKFNRTEEFYDLILGEDYHYKKELDTFLDKVVGKKYLNQIAKGENVRVAILDTGIDFTHPSFSNRTIKGFSIFEHSYDYIDHEGHGTFTSGLIIGRDYNFLANAEFYMIKITDDYGRMNERCLLDGIKVAIMKNVNVLIIPIDVKIDIEGLDYLLNIAFKNDMFILTASGNNPNSISKLGKYENIICVTAMDLENQTLINEAPEVDICFPGSNIISPYCNYRYAKNSGSSAAVALAGGVFACLYGLYFKINNEKLKIKNLSTFLEECTVNLNDNGYNFPRRCRIFSFNNFIERYEIK